MVRTITAPVMNQTLGLPLPLPVSTLSSSKRKKLLF